MTQYSLKNVLGIPYTNASILYSDKIYTAVFNRILKTDLKRNTQSSLPFESKSNIIFQSFYRQYLVTIDIEGQLLLSSLSGEVMDRMSLKETATALHCTNDFIVVGLQRRVQIWRYDENGEYWMQFIIEREHMTSSIVTCITNFGDYIITGHENGEIRFYSNGVKSGFPIVLSKHRCNVIGLHISNSNLYSVTKDGSVFYWKINFVSQDPLDQQSGPSYSVELVEKYFVNKPQTSTLCSSMHADTLVLGHHTGLFDIFEMPSFNHIQTLSLKQRIDSIKFDPSGEFIAIGSRYGHLIVWEWKSESFLYKQSGHFLNCETVAVNDHFIASGDSYGVIKLFNAFTGNCIITFTEHRAAITQIIFSKNNVLLSSSLDGTVKAFDIKRYKHFRTMSAPNPVAFTCMAICGDVVCAGTRDTYEVYVWFLTTGELLDTLSGHSAPISDLKFINNTLITGSWDKTVRLWSIFDSSQNVEVINQSSDVLSISVNPVRQEYAVGCLDGTISIWDLQGVNTSIIHVRKSLTSGRHQSQITKAMSDTYCSSITYSADGQSILGGGVSKYICVFTPQQLVQRIEISRNLYLDGTKSVLNSKKMTSVGISKDLLNDKIKNDSEENTRKDYALSLPGIITNHDPGKRAVRPGIQVHDIKQSADGLSTVVATTEGVFLYSTQDIKLPIQLEVDTTPASCRLAIKNKQYLRALMTSVKINDLALFKVVMESTPTQVYEMVCNDIDNAYYAAVIKMVSEYLESTSHFEMTMEFVVALLTSIHLQDSKSRDIKVECKGLKRVINMRYKDLERVAVNNKYLLMFAQKQEELNV
eukprot:NODE_587_length_6372_cov_0.270524.p1 type:complete len:814 gc:universal NODE_587_length_6372_cov_0.270524:308-2749(+)